MALSYKSRKRLSILALVVWLPAYIVLAVSLTNWFDARFGRLPILAELLVYIVLGALWALPLRPIFLGVGKADPDTEDDS